MSILTVRGVPSLPTSPPSGQPMSLLPSKLGYSPTTSGGAILWLAPRKFSAQPSHKNPSNAVSGLLLRLRSRRSTVERWSDGRAIRTSGAISIWPGQSEQIGSREMRRWVRVIPSPFRVWANEYPQSAPLILSDDTYRWIRLISQLHTHAGLVYYFMALYDFLAIS